MASLIESRRHLIAAALLAGGAVLAACTDEQPPGPDQNLNPACGTNCAGTTAGGVTGGVSPGSPGAGGLPGLPSLTGGTTGVPSTPGLTGGTMGTTAGGTAAGTDGAAGVPCAVRKVVQDRCGSCHGATPAGSPMSLVTLANWQATSTTDRTKKYWELAKVRINAATSPMPPPAIGTLSAAEKTTLNDWLNAGALSSNETCQASSNAGGGTAGGMPGGDVNNPDTTGLECHKLLAHAQGNKTAKYNVGAATDKYINFGFQAPWQGTVYGVVVKPVIDNSRALHHWLLYREQVADGSVAESIGQHSGELIHGWAPGGIPMDFRRAGNVGFELPASTYSVEIHYNSSDPNAQDASGVELCVSRTKPQNLASQSWLGYDQGGVISYGTGLCLSPATSWTGTCRPSSQQPIHLLFMTPHLHQTGRHLKAVINGPNGSRVLHDKPFDFAYQVSYETKEVLMPGESITTTCTFSAPNCAGQKTSQEMCYLFTYYYPAGALVDNGPEGTLMHGEGVCLGQ
jgi:Copper type II ascorbate-dependent monooxygenase, C-terminal domain